MIIERAEILIRAGSEGEFAGALDEGRAILAAAPNCRSVKAGRGVENPNKFILLLEWQSVDDHLEFTKTLEFARFKALVGHLFEGPPSMEHFDLF